MLYIGGCQTRGCHTGCYTVGDARLGDAIRDVGVEYFSSTDVGLGNVRLGDVRLRMSDKGCLTVHQIGYQTGDIRRVIAKLV